MFLYNNKSHYKNTAGVQEKLKEFYEIKYCHSTLGPIYKAFWKFHHVLLRFAIKINVGGSRNNLRIECLYNFGYAY